MPSPTNVPELAARVKAGERSAIARAITIVESKLPMHRVEARELLRELGPTPEAVRRVGISGVPGAGKSTFTNAMGTYLIEQGHKVAVLAVDPSSSRTGGSVLGDRTRMAELTTSQNAFVRPSPSGCHLGGVARATREAMLVVEAAGYDVVIVETVGVGQSEVAVAGMVDTFLLIALTGAGDQLQGIKRGILELCDVIAVNKADGDNAPRARVTARDLAIAMKLVTSDENARRVPVLTCSAQEKIGLPEVWAEVEAHRKYLEETVGLQRHRANQQIDWMWSQIDSQLVDYARTEPALRTLARRLEYQVGGGAMNALDASGEFLEAYLRELSRTGFRLEEREL